MLLSHRSALNEALYRQSFMDFTTVTRSMWILAMDGTFLLDNAAPLMTEMIFSNYAIEVVAGVFYILYMFLSAQLVMQTLLGMLVDVVVEVNSDSRTEMAVSLLKQELLQDLLGFADADGKISHEELMQVMSDDKSKAVLKKLGINIFFLYELQKILYTQHPNAKVPIDKVLELMLVCRGDQNVTVDTIA